MGNPIQVIIRWANSISIARLIPTGKPGDFRADLDQATMQEHAYNQDYNANRKIKREMKRYLEDYDE